MPLAQQPGLLYVAATLLPLASFVLLLLVGGLRCLLRRYRDTATGEGLYRALGGDAPGRGAAYVATLAIGLSFVLSVAGFVQFNRDYHAHEVHPAAAAGAEAEEEAAPVSHWEGRLNWASVGRTLGHESDTARTLQLGYRIDSLNAVMFLMVTFIATLIHLFSIGYMSDELKPEVEDHVVPGEHGHLHRRGRFGRFFLFLSLFCFSMLNLILADNLFQVFLSWELVGVCSYLLIGYYFERHSASTAANKAFITNRVGDAGFIIGLLILWTYCGTFNFEELFARVRAPLNDVRGKQVDVAGKIVRANVNAEHPVEGGQRLVLAETGGSQAVLFPRQAEELHNVRLQPGEELDAHTTPRPGEFGSIPYWLLVLAGLGIFLGCVGKSAQFPLQVWLPDAMEGPTPVSALIHAATMVAAGVYLVGRCYPLFTPEVLLVIAYIGGITLFVAASIAVVMTDIKKVLAYSTVSQLGYMMLALGVGGWVAGLFHLVTHAFFKALLFLGSGSVIYGCHHEQDMEKMGGLYPKMKVTALTMLMGVLAIAGALGFSGWYSKDAILAQAFGFARVHPEHGLLFALPLITAGITTFYMFRMWFLTFTGRPRDHHVYDHAHESPPVMTIPLILLAICSVCVAWGWPFFSPEFPFVEARTSLLERQIHHAQPLSVMADFGVEPGEQWPGSAAEETTEGTVRGQAHALHGYAGNLALGLVVLAFVFALLIYYFGVFRPAEAKAQFLGIHRFLWHKWYFDELYSAMLVRPALVVAGWCRAFDTHVIDGLVNHLARGTVLVSRWDGLFDLGIIDGLVNVTARAVYATGAWLRNFQTGYLRSYVLFLVLAAVAIFIVLSYLFTSLAAAGG